MPVKALVASVVQFFGRLRNGVTISNSHFENLVARVNVQADEMTACTDEQLKARFDQLRGSFRDGRPTDEFAVNVFAVAQEVAFRTTGMRPYDVQLLAAFAMNSGLCVEMQTGEGKTLAAAVLVCLKAMHSDGVHVLTFNDYLAERDAGWMKPIFDFIGLTAGHVVQGMARDDRRKAWNSDVCYVTAKEAGFEYLRDQLCQRSDERVMRGCHSAVVDEADSILIDEARIPLVIATEDSSQELDASEHLPQIAAMIRPLRQNVHFEIKASGRNVSFTETGLKALEKQLGIAELHSEEHAETLARLNLALQAEVLLKIETDYIVRAGQLELIDEFTGRVAKNRKWPGGLQAALEAKEGLHVQPQGRILNSVTLQHFMEFYSERAGMTGTAVPASEEFLELYGMKVLVIPPNRPCVRIDHPDRVFHSRQAKQSALVADVQVQFQNRRPVLIGTASVGESENLAEQLRVAGVECRILNAANDHLEADIIAEAGAPGAITISTNMAGRGTDICLGGSDSRERQRVVDLGGLYLIGTNRHESRRIDNQLRGRAGRQGDPGESRFYVSLEDDLLSRHGIAELVAGKLSSSESQEIVDPVTAQRISFVQRIIEGESFEILKTLRVYSCLLELQRRTISKDRQDILDGTRRPEALDRHAPEFRAELAERWGQDAVVAAERTVTLIHLDWCWSDHLAHAAEIRHGIHLVTFGGFNPYDVFNREMKMEFDSFLRAIEMRVVATMKSATFTKDGIDLEKEGLKAPSSTWTFMINDNPRGAVLGQLLRGVIRRLRQAVS